MRGTPVRTKSPVRENRAFLFVIRRRRSIVPINLLAPLMALLRFYRERRDGAGVQALEGNRLAGLLAEAVRTILDPAQRRVDLGDQFPLTVAGAQLQLALGLGRGAVGQVGMRHRLGLQILD